LYILMTAMLNLIRSYVARKAVLKNGHNTNSSLVTVGVQGKEFKVFALLSCYAAYVGSYLPTSRSVKNYQLTLG
jgi:hypothetical protein